MLLLAEYYIISKTMFYNLCENKSYLRLYIMASHIWISNKSKIGYLVFYVRRYSILSVQLKTGVKYIYFRVSKYKPMIYSIYIYLNMNKRE